MKINWKVRLRNPVFWVQIVVAVSTPVLAYFGLAGTDITTWGVVAETAVKAISNPYVCVCVAVSVWNAINDPTTKGMGDSDNALTYVNPKSKEVIK